MGQLWDVFNLDKKQRIYGGELGYVSFWEGLVDTVVLLARPIIPSKRLWPMTTRLLQIKLNPTTCPLLKLPTELIFYVFEFLDDPLDVIVFCMAHGILGAVGEPHLYKCAADILTDSSWAGGRLMCIGNRLKDDDYPKDVQEHIDRELERYVSEDTQHYEDHPCQFKSYLLEEATQALASKSKLYAIFNTRRWIGMQMQSSMRNGLTRAIYEMDPFLRKWLNSDLVLCNISKGEYVRGKAIDELNNEGPDQIKLELEGAKVNLDHVLSAYICWSSDDNCYVSCDNDAVKKLTRGRWAGDRFEVVQEDEMRRDVDWVDVTDEAVARLQQLW